MNNLFSFRRFFLLLRKYFNENAKQTAVSLLALAGIITITFVYITVATGRTPEKEVQFVIFSGFFLLTGGIYASGIFSQYAGKQRAIAAITLPASQFEKYFLAFLFTVILFPIVFIAVFYIVDFFVLYVSLGEAFSFHHFRNVFIDNHPVFLCYMLVNAIALCGAIYFNKLHFVKTAAIFFILLFVLVYINTALTRTLIPEYRVLISPPFNGVRFLDKDNHYYSVDLPERIQDAYFTLAICGLTLCFWVSSYFKIKEKEV